MMNSFRIVPILGRKVDVPQDDLSLFKSVGENIALTHDVGGLNFSLSRKRNACSKAHGHAVWSNSATAQATKCTGLFELYDGTNRDHCFFDNGKFYVYDSSKDPADKSKAATTYQKADTDLLSAVRVGSHIVFGDREDGETIQSWKNGDANAADAISGGTAFKFRYLEYFMQRLVGCYSDQTNGDIDIRWSGALPVPATSLEFAATNQMYAPNDDPIAGIKRLGTDRCYVYSEDSIHHIIYYPDFTTVFRIFTVVHGQGAVNHQSIVSDGVYHYLFNKSYGFCAYDGGRQLVPISDAIEEDIEGINTNYYNLIVGTFKPLTREIVWTVPTDNATTPSSFFIYNIDTKNWTKEDKTARYVDNWLLYESTTWNDLITQLGGTGATWEGAIDKKWSHYMAENQEIVFGNTDGKLYNHTGESLAGSALNGYRVEPVLNFSGGASFDFLKEIWFNISYSANFSIDVWLRSGNTVGEIEQASWTSVGSISCNDSSLPKIDVDQNARLHQLKWGTDAADEPFRVREIDFRFTPGSEL